MQDTNPDNAPAWQLEAAQFEIAKLRRLIIWLSRTYGDNDPNFHYHTFNGNELPENKELYQTWMAVVRGQG